MATSENSKWTNPIVRRLRDRTANNGGLQPDAKPIVNNLNTDIGTIAQQAQANQQTPQANYDPVQVATGMTPFGQSNQQQTQQTVNNNQQYKLYDPMMSNQYNSVISGMLTGSAYDPFEQANKEALARTERQQRAETADQINRFGALGQGIGSQIANATESNLQTNRFAQNLENAKAREELKQKGLSAYENSINAENNLTNVDRNKLGLESDQVNLDRNKVALDADKNALEQNRFELQKAKSETADTISGDFASYIQNATGLKNATAEQIASDQGAMNYGQQMWESMGGTGQVKADWVKQMADRVNDPVLNDTFVSAMNDAKTYLSQGLIDQDEYNAIEQANKLALSGGLTVDENGNLALKNIESETTAEDEKNETQNLVDEVTSGVYTYQQIKSDPERLQTAKENAVPLSTDTTVDKSGRNTRKFNSVPEKNVPFTWNGKTLLRTGDKSTVKNRGKGYDWEQFTAIDVDTGETVTIKSNGLGGGDAKTQTVISNVVNELKNKIANKTA